MKIDTFHSILACLLVAAIGCGSDPKVRPPQKPEELLAARTADDKRADSMRDSMQLQLLTRAKAEYDAAASIGAKRPVINVLVISGGGDWGAFGAGLLKGWGTVPSGEMARPHFDVVTGVSTGALIAPFAFLGDDASIDKIVQLYRNPHENWVKPRGLIAFLSGGESYAEIPGLEDDMRQALDMPMLRRIVDEGAEGRVLAVNTTDIDASEMCAWDLVAEANRSVQTNDANHIHQILLASAAIPGVFPPRLIDGTLYIDGGVTGNILFGVQRGGRVGFHRAWHEKYPDIAPPVIRYWIVFNNEIRWPPTLVQPKWSSVLAQSSTASTRAATLNAMRLLFFEAELAKLKYNADMQVRIVAVPDGWIAPKPGVFVKETMNALADLGEKMGADPSSWQNEPP